MEMFCTTPVFYYSYEYVRIWHYHHVSIRVSDTEMASVRRVLDRHILGKPSHPSSLLNSSPDIVKPIIIILGGLKADAIRLASLRTAGATGRSDLDATA